MDNTSIGILRTGHGFFCFCHRLVCTDSGRSVRVFTKAGLAGWKLSIPIYSEYCTFKISWKTMFFWIVIVAGIVSGMLTGKDGKNQKYGFCSGQLFGKCSRADSHDHQLDHEHQVGTEIRPRHFVRAGSGIPGHLIFTLILVLAIVNTWAIRMKGCLHSGYILHKKERGWFSVS